MHLYFVSRAAKHNQDLFNTILQGKFFPWKRWNLNVCECNVEKSQHDNKKCHLKKFTPREEIHVIQGALRPVQLMEYVFPEECRDEVLTMFDFNTQGKELPVKLGMFNKFFEKIKKMLGLEPIPDYVETQKKHVLPLQNVVIYPLGLKKDRVEDAPQWGFRQEML